MRTQHASYHLHVYLACICVCVCIEMLHEPTADPCQIVSKITLGGLDATQTASQAQLC